MANTFQVGINYPWIDYAWDFGAPPSAWVNEQYVAEWREKKRRQIVEDFRAFAEMGLFAVRWFILADGLSYGTGAEAPKQIDGKWTFDPLPPEHVFHQQLFDDFEFVLETCAEVGIQFVPSLIDFHWCHAGTVADAGAGIVKGGRQDIVCDEVKRTAFFDRVLEPLLDISVRHREAIYAWELINEPEWVAYTPSFLSSLKNRFDPNKTVPQSEMLEFIAAGIECINARRAFDSTMGFAHWDALESWDSKGLGVTLHQYHYYAPDNRWLPGRDYPDVSQCFIGEFATKFHRGWPELAKGDMARTITARLKCVAEKGYPAAFLWSARATDEATMWTKADHQETARFIKSSRDDVA
jgi:hypothetical protein